MSHSEWDYRADARTVTDDRLVLCRKEAAKRRLDGLSTVCTVQVLVMHQVRAEEIFQVDYTINYKSP